MNNEDVSIKIDKEKNQINYLNVYKPNPIIFDTDSTILKKVFHHIPQGIILMNKNYQIIYSNK